MEVIEWIRFLIGTLFILCGLLIFLIEMIGVFRFKYVLNRMHAAAMGDTLGIASSLIGLMIISGFNFTSLKLFCVIVFLWFSSPTSSHLIARLEVATDEKRGEHYSVIKLNEPMAERKQASEPEPAGEQKQASEREPTAERKQASEREPAGEWKRTAEQEEEAAVPSVTE